MSIRSFFEGLFGAGREERDAKWRLIAADLGLQIGGGPSGERIAGTVRPELYAERDGTHVFAGVRSYTTGSGNSRRTHYRTYADVAFDPALKRGLEIRDAGGSISRAIDSLFGRREIQLGDPELDRAYVFEGLDETQVRALITGGVAGALRANAGVWSILVTDSHVRYELTGIRDDAAEIRPMLEATITLGRAIAAAWQALPPSREEIDVGAVWRPVVEQAGLAYELRGMVGRGRSGEVAVRAELLLDDKRGWCTHASCAFDPELEVGLALTDQGMLTTITRLFGSQDIATGDRAFDGRFVIKGHDEDSVKALLDDTARAQLLELRAACDELTAVDTGIAVRLHRIASADDLAATLKRVAAIGTHLAARRRPAAVGPYR